MIEGSLPGALLDGQVYEADPLDDGSVEVQDSLQTPVLILDLSKGRISSAQGHWQLVSERRRLGWRLLARDTTGQVVAHAAPALIGFSAYSIGFSADAARFRMRQRGAGWRISNSGTTAAQVTCANVREPISIAVQQTGLTQSDLSVLIGIVLLLQYNDVAVDRAEGSGYVSVI